MNIITPQQIRAARALVNWSQQELADDAGISLNALNNIEQEVGNPREKTLLALKKSLEREGILFIGDTGAKRQTETFDVETYGGDQIPNKYFEELELALKLNVDELLFGDLDNVRFKDKIPKVLDKWLEFGPRLENADVKVRSITELTADATYYNEDRSSYREIITPYFGTIPYYVYGNNVSVIIWGPPPKMVIFRSKAIANIFRAQFNLSWSQASEISEEKHKKGLRT